MQKKQFKTESKKLLDMMVNSIYTHKEIFLRELISNASDAIDKLYFRSLTDDSVKLGREDYEIRISADKEARTLTVSDNGCGMSRDDLENNLGTIAKSGSLDFKKENADENIDIIGQFGVGFYSAFMVADSITVESRVYGSGEAWRWQSEGADGYTVAQCEKPEPGTTVILHIKPDTDDEHYGEYLEEFRIRSLVKKYSDYIRYPVRMRVSHRKPKEGSEDEYETVFEDETLNSMVPIWQRSRKEVTDDDCIAYYKEHNRERKDPCALVRVDAGGSRRADGRRDRPRGDCSREGAARRRTQRGGSDRSREGCTRGGRARQLRRRHAPRRDGGASAARRPADLFGGIHLEADGSEERRGSCARGVGEVQAEGVRRDDGRARVDVL